MRKKIEKETGQPPYVIMDNIIKISSQNNIPVKVVTKAGKEYEGIAKKPLQLFSDDTFHGYGIYLSQNDGDNEIHTCIPNNSIDSLTLTTEKGGLDGLIKYLN